jgi:hypothetical protein
VYKNGSLLYGLNTDATIVGYSNVSFGSGTRIVQLNAGEYIDIRNNVGAPSVTFSGGQFEIQRLSGPSAIAASETVAAVYKTASGQSIPNSAFTVLDYTTKEIDTHGAVTTGASWKFTAPISGTYCVSAKILFNSAASSTGGSYLIGLHKGGTLIGELGRVNGTGASNFFGPTGSRNIFLLAGEFIDVRASQDSGGARTLFTSVEYNHVSIHRIGN